MAPTPEEAAAALRQIEAAQRRSRTLHGYENTAPQWILWGVIWVLGYGLAELFPAWRGMQWLVLVPAGIAGGFVLTRRSPGKHAAAWRIAGVIMILQVFFWIAFALLWPVTQRQIDAFPPLVIAMISVAIGLWLGWRFVVTGVSVAGLTVAGFYFVHSHFDLWMALVGGGALILSGLWLKRP
jgi:hypothetical protein